MLDIGVLEVVIELVVLREHICVLCEKTENQPYAKFIKILQVIFCRICVLFQKLIIQLADNFSRFERDFHFTMISDIVVAIEKRKLIILL